MAGKESHMAHGSPAKDVRGWNVEQHTAIGLYCRTKHIMHQQITVKLSHHHPLSQS